jgi:DNA-binding NarL/FixJ family response regulator
MSDGLRVLIADGHAPTRERVRASLEAGSCQVVAEAATSGSAVTLALELQPQVCLLDIDLPGNGITAATSITEMLPETAVIMLTASRDYGDLFAALRAGASGYLLKDMDPARLCPAMHGVLAGETVLPNQLVRNVVRDFPSTPRRRFAVPDVLRPAELTEREAEVLNLMAEGLSTDEIATKMFVAPVTVRTHVRAVLRKLRVPDREAAVRRSRGEA